MNEMLIFWLVILIVAIVAEMLTMGLTSIWFAGGALVSIIATALHGPVWLQVILFFAVSLLLLIFTRPVAVKYFNANRVKTNTESLIGKQAIVISEIDNLQGTGQVTLNGQEWSARSTDAAVRIPVGCVVDVMSIAGVKLMVRINDKMPAMEKKIPEPLSVSQMEEAESE